MTIRFPADEYDYVIVGSGSAGAVMAGRLSEDPDTSVLVLEAGPMDRSPVLRLPAAARYAFNAPAYNWSYVPEPEPHLAGRRLTAPRGRVLGGSSSINGLVYLRGNPLDYEAWARAGATGWSYAEVLPYFQRLERRTQGGRISGEREVAAYQGTDGPVHVTTVEHLNPISAAFLQACAEAGYEPTGDVNGFRQEGAGRFPMTAAGGLRSSAARAYLHPARSRPNLTIATGASAERVEFEGRRAVGVRYRRRGRSRQVRARREVVLAAGAFNSPQLLMLSGIGPAEHLGEHGIAPLVDLPGVGANLLDHPITAIQLRSRRPDSLARHLGLAARARALARWAVHRDGVLASNHFECGAFLRTAAGIECPDLQLYLFPIAVAPGRKDFLAEPGFQVQVSPQRTLNRGRVRLRSADPTVAPWIRFDYLADERDLAAFRTGVRLAREILAQPAMAPFLGDELAPGAAARSDEALDRFTRDTVESGYHPSGTCKMGTDELAVVDPQCRVHGVDALRVADASIMPVIPACNLNCPTMMIGEKAADLIAGRAPLAPSNLPYHVDPQWRTRQRPGQPRVVVESAG